MWGRKKKPGPITITINQVEKNQKIRMIPGDSLDLTFTVHLDYVEEQ